MNNRNARKRNAIILPVAIILFGLLLRLAYLYFNVHAPDFDSPVLDPQFNDYWARALVSGNWTPPPHADNPEIRTTPYGRPPGYPLLLAGIYLFSRGSYLAPRCIQILIGTTTILLVYLLGRRLFDRVSGAVASFLMAIFWAGIYFEGELNSPTWEVFFSLAMILLLLRWDASFSLYPLLGAAFCLAFGALMRPNLLLPGCVLTAWIFWRGYLRHKRFSRALMYPMIFAIVVLLLISPALIRNWLVSRQFVLISYYGGINTYIGNNMDANGTSPDVPDLYEISGVEKWNCFNYPSIVKGLARHLDKNHFSFADASHYFYRRAFNFWREHPGRALTLTLRKAWYFWGPYEISDSKVVYYERLHSPLLAYLPRFSHLLALVLAGLLGWFFISGKDSAASGTAPGMVLLFVIGYFLSILPFFITERYRFPVMPLLLPFAGYAIALLFSFFKRKQLKRFFALSSAALFCLLAVSFPLLPYVPDHSRWYLHRGIAYAAGNDTQDAVDALRKAISLDPQDDEAHLQLGYLLIGQGQTEAAIEQYRLALTANPNNVFAANNLGYEYFLQGDYEEAEAQYRHALARQPVFTLALNNLGNTLLQKGDMDGALACFNKVLDINGNDPFARYNMGTAYLETGQYDKAIEIYTQAFTEQPFNPNIANNLGLALARSGELEASIPWFEKALSLAPVYPLAHFNLGNVYGDLGNVEEACRHYEQVLAVWPEHAESLQRSKALCAHITPSS